MSILNKILLKKESCKSVWFMRQAGRYLPEFRKIRSKNSNFIKLCLNSELSSEITLQPLKRFDLDAAIIFSDILMVPYALGQEVKFKKNQGPQLGNFNLEIFSNNSKKKFSNKLEPIYRAIEITRKKLEKNKSLISFVGAPWTLLIYMMSFKKDKVKNLNEISDKSKNFDSVIDELVDYLCIHINNQINAGSDVVQIFDSWAGLIPNNKIESYCFLPNSKIVKYCKNKNIPTICFPKGIKEKYLDFNEYVKPEGINLDYEIDPVWAKKNLKKVVLQGGLNPNLLLKSDSILFEGATKYIKTFKDIPYVFNLGHGLLPETDPDKVSRLIKFYRNFDG